MKQYQLILRTLLPTLLLGMSFYSIANERSGEANPGRDLRGQIENLIKDPDLTSSNLKREEAFLHFFVNEKGEAVVLFIETESPFVDNYLKARLNYKKLKDVSMGRYKMKVIIKNGSSALNEIKHRPKDEISEQSEYKWKGFSPEVRKSITSKISSIHNN